MPLGWQEKKSEVPCMINTHTENADILGSMNEPYFKQSATIFLESAILKHNNIKTEIRAYVRKIKTKNRKGQRVFDRT